MIVLMAGWFAVFQVVTVTDTTVTHIDALHKKISRKASVVTHNKTAAMQFSEDLSNRFSQLQKTHEDALNGRVSKLEAFGTNIHTMVSEQNAVSKSLAAKNAEVVPVIEASQQQSVDGTKELAKSFAQQFEGNFEALAANKAELDGAIGTFVRTDVAQFVASQEQTISAQTALINSMQTLVAGFVTAQKNALTEHSQQIAQQIERLQHDMEEHVGSLTNDLEQQKASVAALAEERNLSSSSAMESVQQQIGALLKGFLADQAQGMSSGAGTVVTQIGTTLERVPTFKDSVSTTITSIGATAPALNESSSASMTRLDSDCSQLKDDMSAGVAAQETGVASLAEKAQSFATSMSAKLQNVVDSAETTKNKQVSELENYQSTQIELIAAAQKSNAAVQMAIETSGSDSTKLSESQTAAVAAYTTGVLEDISTQRATIGEHIAEATTTKDTFVQKTMREDMPTGQTPQRQAYEFNRVPAATRPHNQLLAEFRSQRTSSLQNSVTAAASPIQEGEEVAAPANSETPETSETPDEPLKSRVVNMSSDPENPAVAKQAVATPVAKTPLATVNA